ncbi:MAG: UDP-N-acetylglucosamine pyrophosphorylase [Kiritimatiellia bacterium]|nr:UDP-N-acetylglucosamine pyrophosphorylase [Lentisphaerota bacterium]
MTGCATSSMHNDIEAVKAQLLQKGVRILQPESVFIDPAVTPARIAPGVVIHPGCRITGAQTSIGPGCCLGAEAPVTLHDCCLGSAVSLQGGFFDQATLLNRANMGSGAHVRPGTLIEEEAGGAHTVGLKQTILLPFVTLGSLINFCDCLMAGGTSRSNHSEVGSSYIHFNYTPHQDKATPSLIGNVPDGVMLNQSPIFLGGQGGLVGPACITYGVVIPAGIIARGDIRQPGLFTPDMTPPHPTREYRPGRYRKISRIVANNLRYIGNIIALRGWYGHIRAPVMSADPFQQACLQSARAGLNAILEERLRQMDKLSEKMPASLELHGVHPDRAAASNDPEIAGQFRLHRRWPEMRGQLIQLAETPWPKDCREVLGREWPPAGQEDYIDMVRTMPAAAAAAARRAMQQVIATATGLWPA